MNRHEQEAIDERAVVIKSLNQTVAMRRVLVTTDRSIREDGLIWGLEPAMSMEDAVMRIARLATTRHGTRWIVLQRLITDWRDKPLIHRQERALLARYRAEAWFWTQCFRVLILAWGVVMPLARWADRLDARNPEAEPVG